MAAKLTRFLVGNTRSVLCVFLRPIDRSNIPRVLPIFFSNGPVRDFSTRFEPLESTSSTAAARSQQDELRNTPSNETERHPRLTIVSESDEAMIRPKPADSHRSQSAFDDELVNKFINCMMWDGKKSLSQGVFTQALQEIKRNQLEKQRSSSEPETIVTDPMEIFQQAVENVKPVVGCIPLRKAGKVFQVPAPLNPTRRRFFAIKWIIDAARDQSGPKNARMAQKMAKELLDAYNNEGTAIRKKQELHKRAEANRAFAHYRWW